MDVETDWAQEAEARVLDHALAMAARTGWNGELVAASAAAAGLSPGEAELLLPYGARDLAALMARRHDKAALATLSVVDPADFKVRARIGMATQAWLDAVMADEAAVRRCLLFLSWPSNLALAFALGWDSADALWRWAGDVSTDENHYSKRAILAAILASTLAVRLASGPEAARRHLAARIDNVMAFETWKAKRAPPRALQHAAEALGRLRYGRTEPVRPLR